MGSHAAGLALAGICGGSFITIERALIVSMTQKQMCFNFIAPDLT